jgi:hypothetical protein
MSLGFLNRAFKKSFCLEVKGFKNEIFGNNSNLTRFEVGFTEVEENEVLFY